VAILLRMARPAPGGCVITRSDGHDVIILLRDLRITLVGMTVGRYAYWPAADLKEADLVTN